MLRTLRLTLEVEIEPQKAFDVLIEELTSALARKGIRFEPGENGRIVDGSLEAGRVISWNPGERILLEWRQAEWKADEITEMELRFEAVNGGTRIDLEHRGWGGVIGDDAEITGWFANEVAAPLLRATAPYALADWITNRRARRPTGAQSRAIYRDPLYHYPGFRVILNELQVTRDDYLVEVGCGGGALLKQILESGCRAAAVDHSDEMVQLAQETNRQAVSEGRLEVRHASADHLPFPDSTFTCATMAGVFGFLPDAVAALREMHRVLREGGRIVVQGSDPSLRGTIAAPEPFASRLHFYSDDELAQLARQAGFTDVRVVRQDEEQFAREAGVPEEHIILFRTGSPFLLARKTGQSKEN